MIVEPASLGPRSRPRRTLRAIALAVPVLLLVAVVGVGLMGRPSPRTCGSRSRPPRAVAVADPSAPGPDPVVGAGPMVQFPTRAAGLEVHGVRSTLEARDRGLVRGGVVAVAGYLALDEQPSDCVGGGLGIAVPFCERTGVLAEDPWSGVTDDRSRGCRRSTSIRSSRMACASRTSPPAPAGSAAAASPSSCSRGLTMPRAAQCIPGGRHCGQELVVERVAWIDGEDFPRDRDGGPAVSGSAPPATDRAPGGLGGSRLLPARGLPAARRPRPPHTLADLDPEAEAAVPRRRPRRRRVVRARPHRAGDPRRRSTGWSGRRSISASSPGARSRRARSGAPDTP